MPLHKGHLITTSLVLRLGGKHTSWDCRFTSYREGAPEATECLLSLFHTTDEAGVRADVMQYVGSLYPIEIECEIVEVPTYDVCFRTSLFF